MAKYLLATDGQRSVLSGSSSPRRAYSPYGTLGNARGPWLGFAGQQRDQLTGNYPLGNGHRFYSPTLMRFMVADRLSPFSKGGINAYAYCGGDPVNRVDPSGEFWGVILRGIGIVSSGTTLLGALARTAKNVVGRRMAFRNGTVHGELPSASRTSNLHYMLTGVSGLGGQVAATVTGVTPGLQTAADVLGAINAVTSVAGGMTGNYAAAKEVVHYMRQYPREIPGVLFETLMDVTMVDEMLSTVGRGLEATAARIRRMRTPLHEVQA
ncbi:RHS repeat-associated core domain-containing protein [Pantoea sp. Tr-811]|uniref:RHS repeat-associated core domain-containing protein n=1 Tax=Pantoea sp. Tr-811 TaxID=2608361 RepID=UPI00141EF515|nr:RHS repeat-associated core domain-containing protein [Pantoea sp. Tr-811]NIF26293.1 RHS repeat-associated core domain-containing protein [Pantoea sp. Tr-811]